MPMPLEFQPLKSVPQSQLASQFCLFSLIGVALRPERQSRLDEYAKMLFITAMAGGE
jgi:hypothetical protein